ncbi:MAG: hypothetical protein JW837_04970 [Sedimentisphaerales bacterium]|nr:hypothetical protein [Sedimentisphaerales bacterium]
MAKWSWNKLILMVVCFVAGLQIVGCNSSEEYGTAGKPPLKNDFIEHGRFLQIPGPNPILRPDKDRNAWDGNIIEACDAFKDFGTYYLYYHGSGEKDDYQIGVATSDNPLGPFKKYEGNPIVKIGKKGDWDEMYVACAMVMKEGVDKYYMWYTGRNPKGPNKERWDMGLATAPGPLGPWTPHENNPLIEDFGYVGGVVKVDGKYFMYGEHPRGAARDYGPLILATANAPEGPWKMYENNPVLKPGQEGEWDCGGISEAEVLYYGGVFHLFYAGTKPYYPRTNSRESIGYAYSFDGYNWRKYGLNPVATREENPNAAAFAEVHSIIEPPFVYIYHTLRYKELWRPGDEKLHWVEDLGVQVLVTSDEYSLEMPLQNFDTFEAGRKLSLTETPPINLSGVKRLALTAECTYNNAAEKPLRLEVVTSPDGMKFDTKPLYVFEQDMIRGETVRETFDLSTNVKYIKVLVENPDPEENITDVKVIATLGS